MKELFSLGDLFISDFLKDDEQPTAPPVGLSLMYDDATNEIRLRQAADPALMYGRYWYRSGTNATMTAELGEVVSSIKKHKKLKDGDVWLDIASNDGTLLSQVPKNLVRIGIDPADDSFVTESAAHADGIVQDFFSTAAYRSIMEESANVVTCIAMFYDLDDPDPFLDDVYEVMDDDGLFVLQMSYSPLMVRQTAFDNICHEHIFYYTLTTIKARLEKAGFIVVDCQLNDVNGGSFRVYAMKQRGDVTTFGSQPYRDVCRFRVDSLLKFEEVEGWNAEEKWLEFFHQIQKLKEETVAFIKSVKAEGKSVWGYGASTKGNTLLQYFGLDSTLIDGIAERSPYKYGLRTVGTNIPIESEDAMRQAKPDYLLVLPWHFISEFVLREQEYLKSGGKFIVPCPTFRVIGA